MGPEKIDCDFNDNHAWYVTAMHADVVVTGPIFIFAVYCLIFRSPKAMARYRLHLLNNVIWSYTQELSLTLFSTPVCFCGAPGGYPAGIMPTFISTKVQTAWGSTLIGVTFITILQLFSARYYVIIPERDAIMPVWMSQLLYTTGYTLLPIFICTSGYFLLYRDQAEIKAEAQQQCLSVSDAVLWRNDSILFESNIYIYSFSASLFALLLFVYFWIYLLSVLSLRYLKSIASISKQTVRMQRAYLKALLFQVLVHSVVLLTPSVVALTTMYSRYCKSVILNICILLLSYHSSCGITTMILVNKPYRRVVVELLSKVGIKIWDDAITVTHVERDNTTASSTDNRRLSHNFDNRRLSHNLVTIK